MGKLYTRVTVELSSSSSSVFDEGTCTLGGVLDANDVYDNYLDEVYEDIEDFELECKESGDSEYTVKIQCSSYVYDDGSELESDVADDLFLATVDDYVFDSMLETRLQDSSQSFNLEVEE